VFFGGLDDDVLTGGAGATPWSSSVAPMETLFLKTKAS